MTNSIPKNIQDTLFLTFETVYTERLLAKIAQRYNLENKLDSFSKLVRGTLYGELPVVDLRESLERELGISEEVANYITIELDQDLFSDVRDEFNVAQGLMTVEEYNSEYPGEPASDPAPATPTETPSEPTSPKSVASDPVAASILGDNRRPGAQSDPYREPIDEE